jgi:rhamnose utilization protein RhaD (predicted bifunctional aldolase and dehydrogenase)
MMMSSAAVQQVVERDQPEIEELLELSARIGSDPLLVQGSNGNTSIKVDGTLWIKASGKWLGNAGREQILVPVTLSDCLDRFGRGERFPIQQESSCASRVHPSVETFLHAVLPQRVILHVHSINTIAWSLREDAPQQLEERLSGLRWQWVPYVASGRPLARKIRTACRRYQPDVFVLGNHGLVVCGEDCDTVKCLLFEVERRLALPPRVVPQPNHRALEEVRRISGWRLPDDPAVHTLGTDGHSRRIIQGGVLYPSQAMYLGVVVPQVMRNIAAPRIRRRIARVRRSSPFLVVERSGVLVSDDITRSEEEALRGYAEVVRRIETSATIRYLNAREVRTALNADDHHTGQKVRP